MNTASTGNDDNAVKFNAVGIPRVYEKRIEWVKPLSGNYAWHVIKRGVVCSGKAATWIGPNIILSLLAVNTLTEPYQLLLKRKKHPEI